MNNDKILDLSGYKATLLERAVSIDVARSLMPTVDVYDPMSIAMAISNGFTTGVAYARKKLTKAQIKALEEHFAEAMRRIEQTDNGTAPFQTGRRAET